MRLLIDQDEILCYWSARVLELWNKAHPDKQVANVSTWDTNGFLGHPEAMYFSRAQMLKPEFWANLEPVPGATMGMKQLLEDGHDVMIATQVLPDVGGPAYDGKLQWIRKHMPFFPIDHFYAVRHKSNLKADILFDDAPHQLQAFQKAGGLAVAMHYEWNKKVDCLRVSNWAEFVELVNEGRVVHERSRR